MFFCEKCRYLYDISKERKEKQKGGGDEDEIFRKLDEGEEITEEDFDGVTLSDLKQHENYQKNQKKITKIIKEVAPSILEEKKPKKGEISDVAFFVCKRCENDKPIEPGTLIYSKNYGSSSTNENESYDYVIHDYTLARTKNYICPNKSCKTHKDSSLKEAVFEKDSRYRPVYVCTVCSTDWTYSL